MWEYGYFTQYDVVFSYGPIWSFFRPNFILLVGVLGLAGDWRSKNRSPNRIAEPHHTEQLNTYNGLNYYIKNPIFFKNYCSDILTLNRLFLKLKIFRTESSAPGDNSPIKDETQCHD